MKEIYDFRLTEERAAAVLPPGTGTTFPGGSVRKVVTTPDTEAFRIIGAMHRAARAAGSFFYSSSHVTRRYSAHEIKAAQLFRLRVTGFTHEAGEAAEAPFESLIALDTRRLPQAKDLVVTLAGEYLVSPRLAEILVAARLTGFELRRIRHKERKGEGSFRLEHYPAGRDLIARAEAAGIQVGSGSFYSWLARPEQKPLLAEVDEQRWKRGARSRQRREAATSAWKQLIVTSKPISMVPPTRFGVDPFDEDEQGEYRDDAADIAGLRILSECHVAREEWEGADFTVTRQKVGRDAGLVRAGPLLLVSPRLRELLVEHRVKGCSFEVAYLK